jgi:hypothetical protein
VLGFELGKTTADLDIQRFEVLAPDARVVLGTDAGDVDAPRPEVQLWRGTVVGEEGSHVFFAVSRFGASGFVQTHGRAFIISSGPQGSREIAVTDLAESVRSGALALTLPACDGDVRVPGAPPSIPSLPRPDGPGPTWTCRSFRIAVDCDYEFTQNLFGGDAAASGAYAVTLLGAVSEIYQRDTNVAIELGYLRTWITSADPYSADTTSIELPEFQNYWNVWMQAVPRDLAHLLSGRSLGGGIAYGNVPCNIGYAYAVSSHLTGYFPYPLIDHSAQNWDVVVVTHEMGHNLGSRHTHDPAQYVPPIDGCGNAYLNPPQAQDCSQAYSGTIMSYCHLCPGGEANINLTFGSRVSTAIRTFLDTSASACGNYPTISISAQPQPVAISAGASASFTVGVSGHAPISYQWRKDGVPLSDDAHLAGSHNAQLFITPAGASDAGVYDVLATDYCGTVTTVGVQLSVGCYANCDDSTVPPILNGNDFQCFLNRFGAGVAYANCDGSTVNPVLNANDFLCFLTHFALGCP